MNSLTQPWLPGLEQFDDRDRTPDQEELDDGAGRPRRTPTVEKLLAQASPTVRRLFTPFRIELVADRRLAEEVRYDDSSGSFQPTYTLGDREIVRLHLDPVLAATFTLEPGARQLRRLLAKGDLSEKLKAQTVKCARKSGNRVFLAFLARNQDDVADLLTLTKGRLALERRRAATGSVVTPARQKRAQ